jgi:uncharacterized membrane protein YhaH (DUF805 family)
VTLKQVLLSFDGRISRSTYWVRGVLPSAAIAAFGAPIGALIDVATNGAGFVYAFSALLTLWPSLAVSVKRCHDRGRSGWFLLVGFIPIVGSIWAHVELGWLRGTAGHNRFGPDPVEEGETEVVSVEQSTVTSYVIVPDSIIYTIIGLFLTGVLVTVALQLLAKGS